MRKELKDIENVRDTFIGTFVRTGVKHGYKGVEEPTVLLIDIIRKSDGKYMTEHLWFNLTKLFEKADLKEGDKVQFDARVKEYQKGYRGRKVDVYYPIEYDYKLSYPTKVIKL